jgi:hypothetical protein
MKRRTIPRSYAPFDIGTRRDSLFFRASTRAWGRWRRGDPHSSGLMGATCRSKKDKNQKVEMTMQKVGSFEGIEPVSVNPL